MSVFNGRDELAQLTLSDATGTKISRYGYDLNGAQTSETYNFGTPEQGVSAYQYDFEGHLLATGPQGATKGFTAYQFDANGQRVSTTTKVGLTDEKTTTYLVDEAQPFAQVVEERENNVLQKRYFHGLEMGPIRQDHKDTGGIGGYLTSFALPDGLDSTRQLSDTNGTVTDSYYYDAFGAGLNGGTGQTPNQYRFNGQQLDGASGLYYLRARFYNQGLGRFLSHDPLLGSSQDPVSLHRYLYAGGDSVNAVDPSGEESLPSVVTSFSINTALTARVATGAMRLLAAAGTLGGLYNIYSDYTTSGTVNPWDVAGIALDITLSRVGSTIIKNAFSSRVGGSVNLFL